MGRLVGGETGGHGDGEAGGLHVRVDDRPDQDGHVLRHRPRLGDPPGQGGGQPLASIQVTGVWARDQHILPRSVFFPAF